MPIQPYLVEVQAAHKSPSSTLLSGRGRRRSHPPLGPLIEQARQKSPESLAAALSGSRHIPASRRDSLDAALIGGILDLAMGFSPQEEGPVRGELRDQIRSNLTHLRDHSGETLELDLVASIRAQLLILLLSTNHSDDGHLRWLWTWFCRLLPLGRSWWRDDFQTVATGPAPAQICSALTDATIAAADDVLSPALAFVLRDLSSRVIEEPCWGRIAAADGRASTEPERFRHYRDRLGEEISVSFIGEVPISISAFETTLGMWAPETGAELLASTRAAVVEQMNMLAMTALGSEQRTEQMRRALYAFHENPERTMESRRAALRKVLSIS